MGCNPKFDAVLSKMAAIHDKKSEDYASAANRYSNFEFAAHCASVFTDPLDQAFAVLIGVKLARLGELCSSGKTPNHESIQDTRVDLANYAALWASYHEAPPALDPVNEYIPPAPPIDFGDLFKQLPQSPNTITHPTYPVPAGQFVPNYVPPYGITYGQNYRDFYGQFGTNVEQASTRALLNS